ncbi:MAG TPA: transglutaminase domain-containing protein [bacterium]|nr:transglutaminase domain-containing protein [bacterium]
MKALLVLLSLALCAAAQPFASPQDPALLALAPDSLREAFGEALTDAGQNWRELASAVAAEQPGRRAEVVWLIDSMPHLDRLEMTAATLLEHVEYAHKSLAAFQYRASDSLFRDYILTYRISDEPVTAWRKLLFDRFAPLVRKSRTAADAARTVNGWLARNVHTVKRGFFGPMKSPELVFSSGSGTTEEIAVLAAAILKSVGVPSRRVKVPWLGAEDYDASWLEVYSDGKWLPYYPLEPKAFGDFGWMEREHDDNVTIAVATSAFDQQLVTSSYTAGAQVRLLLTASGVPLSRFENFALSVFNAGAWRPMDELNTVTDTLGRFECFLGNGHYQLAAGQRDPHGDPYVVTREIEVEPNRPLDIALDLTAPVTQVPSYAGTRDFTGVLPDVSGGIASTLPPRGRPGIVVNYDPTRPGSLATLRAVQQLYEKYGKLGLSVQGIAHGDLDAARALARKSMATFTIACEPVTKDGILGSAKADNYDSVILYDKDGGIVFRKARPRPDDILELNRSVAMLLK